MFDNYCNHIKKRGDDQGRCWLGMAQVQGNTDLDGYGWNDGKLTFTPPWILVRSSRVQEARPFQLNDTRAGLLLRVSRTRLRITTL